MRNATVVLLFAGSYLTGQSPISAQTVTWQSVPNGDGLYLNSSNVLYEYSPTAMQTEPDGFYDIWDCAQRSSPELPFDNSRDAIWHARLNPNRSGPHNWGGYVLTGGTTLESNDWHACAPSVVKVRRAGPNALVGTLITEIGQAVGAPNPAALPSAYFMYYECSPVWQLREVTGPGGAYVTTHPAGPGLTDICLAGSIDGWTWVKHREANGLRSWVPGNAAGVTPIITSPQARTACAVEKVGIRYQITAFQKTPNNWHCATAVDFPGNPGVTFNVVDWYGAGHPSVVWMPDGRFRIFYRDNGVSGYAGGFASNYRYVESWDGIHIDPGLKQGSTPMFGEFKYYPENGTWLVVNYWGPGAVFGFTKPSGANSYQLGTGMPPAGDWTIPGETGPVAPQLTIGKTCANTGLKDGAFAPGTILGDGNGFVNLSLPSHVLFAGEGVVQGQTQPGSPCANVSSSQLDTGIYLKTGKFTQQ